MCEIKEKFDQWARWTGDKFLHQQWLLSKWENIEGVLWPEEKIELLLKNIFTHLQPRQTDSLVDLGCGGGWILSRLRGFVAKSCGVDFAMHMIRQAQKLGSQQPWICADISHLPFKEQAFDRALCNFVFINMMRDDAIQMALIEIFRILRPGGRAFISQLPDKSRSGDYDAAKKAYVDHCRTRFNLKDDLKNVYRIPQKLFDKQSLQSFLENRQMPFQLVDSFNPFYFPGQPETVPWRFDLILHKRS